MSLCSSSMALHRYCSRNCQKLKFVITGTLARASAWSQLGRGNHFSVSAREVNKEVDKDQEFLRARPYSEVPKPNNFLDVGWDVIKNPLELSDIMEKNVKALGKIYKSKPFPGFPYILTIVDPKDIEKVYRAGDKDYPQRFPLIEWTKARQELGIPPGMFLEDGEKWLKQRTPISKYIMVPRKMADYWIPFNDVVLELIRYIQSHRDQEDVLVDLLSTLKKWALESTSVFVLGKRLGCLEDPVPPECQDFIESIHGFLSTTAELITNLPLHKFMSTKNWKKLLHHLQTVYSFSSSLVQARIEEIKKDILKQHEDGDDVSKDFLSYMIYSGKMDIKEVAVNAVDLIGAAVDTTSITAASCLYSLATNPHVQEKLRNEVQEVVGGESRVSPDHVQKMHYLRDCIKETQRLYPGIPSNARILKEDIVLSGYRIPAGVIIVMPTAVCGRLPELFPEPENFKPERWSRDREEQPHPFAITPFGYGRRMCVGRRIAELEIHIAVAQIMKNFRITSTDNSPMKYITKIFYYPERKMNLTFSNL